ncbi:MAG: hypothetical protein ACYC5O_16945 [Anaerolineae bacterium]
MLIAGIDEDWSDWFDGLTLAATPPNQTALLGDVPDQAALYGLLAKVRDLGLKLVSVRSRESGASEPYDGLGCGQGEGE